MSLPDFTSMTLPRRGSGQSSGQSSDSSAGLPAARPTAEGIDIPPLAMPDPAALAAVSSGLPGIAPFLRGPYATCLLYTSPSPRDKRQSRMPSSA